MLEFAFRPLRTIDLPLIHQWLNADPVLKWYAKEPMFLAEVEAKYRPRIDLSEPVSVFVATVGGKSAGLFQYYPVASCPEYERAIQAQSGWYGVDFFIGDAANRGHGYAPKLLAAFEQIVAARASNYTALVAGPHPQNTSSIRALQRAGFIRKCEIEVTPHASESIMVRHRAASEAAI